MLNEFRANQLEEDPNHIMTVPYDCFKETFEAMPGWEGHFDEDSLLTRLLAIDFFRPYAEEHPDDLCLDRLLLLGILLCKGNARTRAEVFWSVVQTPDQKDIAVMEKDFFACFQDMFEIGIIILKDFARDQKVSKEINEQFTVKHLYYLFEKYIGTIFGYESKMNKEPWLEKISTEAQWCLKPETMRSYVWQLMQNMTDDDKQYVSEMEPALKENEIKRRGVMRLKLAEE